MKLMTIAAKRAITGGRFYLEHPSGGGFIYYVLSGGTIL
jgi:hypothetical protein